MKDYLQSRTITKIIMILAVILLVLLAFQGGVLVGYRQGAFLRARGMGYERGINDPRSIFAPFMHDGDDENPHGAIGEIVRIASSTLMIKDPISSSEQIISFVPTTTLRFMHGSASTSDLKIGDQVVIIGEPGDNGQINAAFIRILPTVQ